MIATTAPEPPHSPEPPRSRPAPEPPLPPEPPRPTAPGAAVDGEPDSAAPRRRLIDSDAWPSTIILGFIVISAAVPLFAVSVPLDATIYGVHVAIAFAIALLQAGSLPLALRWPWIAVAAFLVGQALFGLFGAAPASTPWPVSVPQIILLTLLVGFLAWRSHALVSLALWAGMIAVPLGLAFLPDRGTTPEGVVANLVTSAAITAMALGVGRAIAVSQRRFAVAIDEERRAGAVEHERRLIAEERTRIARDLHDVVAHRMSVIQVQATSAPYRLPGLDPAVAGEFAEIAQGARDAMAEMRELLAVLRDPDADAATAPQPGIDDLDALVASVRHAGLPVTAFIERDLPGGTVVGQAAYRIVQEALSNVLRHAPGATTTVTVVEEHGRVVVEVVNDASVARSGASDGVEPTDAEVGAAGSAPDVDGVGGGVSRPGHGLVGMRERARLAGGALEARPVVGGGFRVRAVLPGGARAAASTTARREAP
ncbi:sensor histidine kinase [Agromyces sp. G08B096]|uniref:histidine kinase n=1 Tax=Agromyces sp. G08B096 TaxID=3156399 RepID=A0AAU7W545_9MICO